MTNQQDQITLHHVCKYRGGPLAIRSIIYGCPDIRWNLVEDPDSWPITPGLIAWSYNREEVEALLQQLSYKPTNLKQQALTALHAVATGANDTREQHQDLDTIRQALEVLPND